MAEIVAEIEIGVDQERKVWYLEGMTEDIKAQI